jgi:hypothetical protein
MKVEVTVLVKKKKGVKFSERGLAMCKMLKSETTQKHGIELI